MKKFEQARSYKKNQGPLYWSVQIRSDSYWLLKNNIKQEEWLGQEHLELSLQWFMQNINSPLVNSFDIV